MEVLALPFIAVAEGLKVVWESIKSGFYDMSVFLGATLDVVEVGFNRVKDFFIDVGLTVLKGADIVKVSVENGISRVGEFLVHVAETTLAGADIVKTAVKVGLSEVSGFLGSILHTVKVGFDELVDRIGAMLLATFLPRDGFFDAHVAALKAKFPLIDSLSGAMNTLVGKMSALGGTAPVITIPLSGTSLSKYGARDMTVDFSWFNPYKGYFHLLLSAILWAKFIHSQYFAIKSIINASSAVADAERGG